jgi:hypothetical protein
MPFNITELATEPDGVHLGDNHASLVNVDLDRRTLVPTALVQLIRRHSDNCKSAFFAAGGTSAVSVTYRSRSTCARRQFQPEIREGWASHSRALRGDDGKFDVSPQPTSPYDVLLGKQSGNCEPDNSALVSAPGDEFTRRDHDEVKKCSAGATYVAINQCNDGAKLAAGFDAIAGHKRSDVCGRKRRTDRELEL